MSEFSLSLPSELQRYVEARTAADGYADSAEFLRDLIRRDQDLYRQDVARVRALVDEGIASGLVDAEPEAVLDGIIADLQTRRE